MKWKLVSTRKLNLWYLSVLYKGMRDDTKDLIDWGYSNILDVSNNQIVRSHVLKEEGEMLGKILLNKLREDEDFINKLVRKYQRRAKKLLEVSDKISDPDTTSLSDRELAGLFREFSRAYQGVGPFLDIPIMFGEEGTKKLKKLLNTRDSEKYIGILTAPPEKSYVAQEEEEFLKIIKGNDIERNLEKHIKKWCWIPFYETGKTWNREHYQKLIKEMSGKPGRIEKRLQELKQLPKKTEEERRKAIDKLKPSKEALVLIDSLQKIIDLKDKRRAVYTKADYNSMKLFREMAKRKGISVDQLKHLTPEETVGIFENNKLVNKELVKSRMSYYVYLMKDGNVDVLIENKAKQIEESEIKEEAIEEKLEGTCASIGKAIGKVKIVLDLKDLDKIKKGDILVSKFTNPNYVTAMKKVAAVITEEGGITSHAAIISREMGIPCIVGAKNVMKHLKNGEKITVDADNGLITRGE